MQQTLTRSLIETLVHSKLKDLKESPERTTRNLVDMALHFSKGRFQKRFFEIAQKMLENENSPYYQMVYHTVANVDENRLLNFGMNLGYNSCTYGAQIIRKREAQLHFNIPWCITLELAKDSLLEMPEHYHQVLQEGKSLGIYTWHLFTNECMNEIFPIIEMNPECAFCLFCTPDEITDDILDIYSSVSNIMFIVQYNENYSSVYHVLKERKFLYSSYLTYTDANYSNIINGELLCEIKETDSSFAVFIPDKHCSNTTREYVSSYIVETLNEPKYKTLPFDFSYHLNKIDAIISDDSCSVWFDKAGTLINTDQLNHFAQSLSYILKTAFPKKQ